MRLHGLVEEQWFSYVFYLGDGALKIECLGQDYLEYLQESVPLGTSVAALHTFCTLMLWLVLLKMRLAFIALAKRLACRLRQ